MPGKRGTSAPCRPTSRSARRHAARRRRRTAWSAKSPGSCPRSIETSRIAPAMRALAMRTMASAAGIASSPSGSPTWVGDGACARPRRRAARACRRCGRSALMRPSTTLASVRVGRVVALRHSRPGPGTRAGALRADLQQAALVDMGDRAAARADGGDLDHRRADDQAEIDGGLRRERRSRRRRSATHRTRCRRDRR